MENMGSGKREAPPPAEDGRLKLTRLEENDMNRYGISVQLKHVPPLDPDFIPLLRFNQAFLADAKKPVGIAVERADGQMASCRTFIHGTPEMEQADHYYINRLVKTILWMKGGFKIYVSGDEGVFNYLKKAYSAGGEQAFDWDYMANIFEHPFEVVLVDDIPFPKITADPDYHYEGIVAGLKSAAEHMPRVDAVGVSSAGVFINNRTMNASLFLQVPKDIYDVKVKDIYIRAIRDTFGDVPYSVINDGDVSALAGAMSLDDSSVLGIAMGTSEAVGYVDEAGRITGWLNELAFVPVDAQPDAMRDEWSGDIGCGVKYFSQDGVIKLAPRAGIELEESLSPAEKLKVVQKLMEEGSEAAAKVYESIGVYLGHTLAYYYELYGCRHVLLLGRVMSGKGGDLILATAQKVLEDEYPETAKALKAELPDEKFRRVGQSMAAASLPELKK